MRPYQHFTLSERRKLAQMLQEGKKLREIAAALGRNVSSISREIKRNATEASMYDPSKAVVRYLIRRRRCVRKPILSQHIKSLNYVKRKLQSFWSPQDIVQRWKKDYPQQWMASVSTLYRAIERGQIAGCNVQTHLRRRGIPYKPTRSKFYAIQPEHTIAELPTKAVNRERIGDWEGDTICGKRGTGGLMSFIDRKTRYCILRFIPDMSAATMEATIVKAFRYKPRKSFLLDNGSEFAHHRSIASALRTTIYFADPHAPWQRGSNESNNGRVRFFFPKGADTRSFSEKDVARIQFLLNNRPLKVLDWLTPAEAFSAKCCT